MITPSIFLFFIAARLSKVFTELTLLYLFFLIIKSTENKLDFLNSQNISFQISQNQLNKL